MLATVVITCTSNYEKFLAEAYQSVLNQTVRPKIIIVDYGLKGNYPEAKIIKPDKPFDVAEARNIGIKEVDTEYLLCLDADDSLQPTYLEKAMPFMDGKTVITAWMTEWGGNDDFELKDFLVRNRTNTEAWMPKQAWIDAGGFDSKCVPIEDWDFWIGVVSKGYKFHLLREPLINYRWHDEQITNTLRFKKSQCMNHIFEKHKSLFDTL